MRVAFESLPEVFVLMCDVRDAGEESAEDEDRVVGGILVADVKLVLYGQGLISVGEIASAVVGEDAEYALIRRVLGHLAPGG